MKWEHHYAHHKDEETVSCEVTHQQLEPGLKS